VPNPKPRIAVFAGPTATILNSAPLITSNLARRRHDLPLLTDAWGNPLRFDVLRPQKLAKRVTIYVEQFSAHPLERDAAHLYAAPDGYLDPAGEVHRERQSDEDIPINEIVLDPADGLIPLPYMSLQRDGSAWEGDCLQGAGDPASCRQPFYPDASRVFEEIDRVGINDTGTGNQLGALADFDFVRVVPSGGYTKGLRASDRTDRGEGDIPPEKMWEGFFPYRPFHLRREPRRELLALVTNVVAATLAAGDYRGGLWLEGSPFTEETTYWLNLLIDTTIPIVGCTSLDWPHGEVGASGDRNLIDAVRYVCSNIWCDESGHDRLGAVLVGGEQIFSARDVQKDDARPGGLVVTGGHGGVLGSMGEPGPPVLTYVPVQLHTHSSEVRLSLLPEQVIGVTRVDGSIRQASIQIKDADGGLVGGAIPHVSIVKHARYLQETVGVEPADEVEVTARIERNLTDHPLAGFVVEGSAPFGQSGQSVDAALRRATFCGMPIVRVGRGNSGGFVGKNLVRLGIAGSNLTATKARLLLMACLLRLGALPPAVDPDEPTAAEVAEVEAALADYQAIFDRH
jgi:L-asparaginase